MAEILVIGGGAAGMMAAVFAAKAGANVTLLEKNEKLGKKVYITGKGRCNLTNDCDLDEFLSQVSRNPRFLYSALSFFSSRDMISLMEENGCPVTVQRGKRVFPASELTRRMTPERCERIVSGQGIGLTSFARFGEWLRRKTGSAGDRDFVNGFLKTGKSSALPKRWDTP